MLSMQVDQPLAWAVIAGVCPIISIRHSTAPADMTGKDVAIYAGTYQSDLHRHVTSNGVTVPASLSDSIGKVIGIVKIAETFKSSQSRWFYGGLGLKVTDVREFAEPFDYYDDPEDKLLFDWDMPPMQAIPLDAELVVCAFCKSQIYEADNVRLNANGFVHNATCKATIGNRKSTAHEIQQQKLVEFSERYQGLKRPEIIKEIKPALEHVRSTFKEPAGQPLPNYSQSFGLTNTSSTGLLLTHLICLRVWAEVRAYDVTHWAVLERAAETVRKLGHHNVKL